MNNTPTAENEESFVIDFEDGRRPSEGVVEAVAAVEGVPAPNLDSLLYDAIDPDALDSLLTGDTRPNRVAFSYHGYEVVVQCDGRIVIE